MGFSWHVTLWIINFNLTLSARLATRSAPCATTNSCLASICSASHMPVSSSPDYDWAHRKDQHDVRIRFRLGARKSVPRTSKAFAHHG